MTRLTFRKRAVGLWLSLAASYLFTATVASAQNAPYVPPIKPTFSEAVAFDVSPPLRTLSRVAPPFPYYRDGLFEIRPEWGREPEDHGYSSDGAIQFSRPIRNLVPSPLVNFEGLSNHDNFNVLGGRVNPPDPSGTVGPNHYIEEINLVYAIYDKQGNKLAGPFDLGSLWQNFPITDCAGESGDPVTLYDRFSDRWILSQFTSAGPNYWNCVAISTTGDPTGTYYRYAFAAGPFFPDYPKYGIWRDAYILTSRDFGNDGSYGISVYGLDKRFMLVGNPHARQAHFFLNSDVVPLNLIGDGLLPADIDGNNQPPPGLPAPIVGTQDDGGGYGATFDALNIWNFYIFFPAFSAIPQASLTLATQIPVAPFDSVFPCAPDARDCLPQPGATTDQYLDHLGYRQRPTFRLAYRRFSGYESMVTNQSVEALPAVSGVRWYEIRRTAGAYSLFQQGTYVPEDGVHRWMGSIAQDHMGNMLLGYSVVNGQNVFPGIRYTGRMNGDPAGQMTLGEATIIDGSGIQRTTNSRWGDYTAMSIDPSDDCTFWYVNEYYTLTGQNESTAGWQTRVASVKLPGCSTGR
jgi:hypothetical protein